MKFRKTAFVLAVIALASSLGGCIIVPGGHGHGGGYRYHDGGYDHGWDRGRR